MVSQKAAEVRDLADDELVDRLAETKEELFNLRFQHVTGQLDNYARLPRAQARDRPDQHRAAGPRDRRRRGAGRGDA